jgi:hypothetical protein
VSDGLKGKIRKNGKADWVPGLKVVGPAQWPNLVWLGYASRLGFSSVGRCMARLGVSGAAHCPSPPSSLSYSLVRARRSAVRPRTDKRDPVVSGRGIRCRERIQCGRLCVQLYVGVCLGERP